MKRNEIQVLAHENQHLGANMGSAQGPTGLGKRLLILAVGLVINC